MHGLSQRFDISRNLIRIWVRKYELGAFDDDAQAADLIKKYEARIAALERLIGKQAFELKFLKGAIYRRGIEPSPVVRALLDIWNDTAHGRGRGADVFPLAMVAIATAATGGGPPFQLGSPPGLIARPSERTFEYPR